MACQLQRERKYNLTVCQEKGEMEALVSNPDILPRISRVKTE